MTKIERLKLENEVLKNIIACVREKIDHRDDNPYVTIGAISATIDFETKIKWALESGYAIDYREYKENDPEEQQFPESATQQNIYSD